MRKIKKIISIVMVIVLIVSTMSITAFADKAHTADGMMQSMYIAMGYRTLTISEATPNTEHFKVFMDSGKISVIHKTTADNGDIVCSIVEGELKNELVIKKSGEIYLNGGSVTISINGGKKEPLIANLESYSSVHPLAQRYEVVDECPYGSPSDYTNSTTTYKVLDLGDKVTFNDVADATWASLVGTAIGIFSIPAGFLFGSGASVAIKILRTMKPEGHSASLKDVRSVHGIYGFTINSGLAVAKHYTTYYSNADYTNEIEASTYYEKFTY